MKEMKREAFRVKFHEGYRGKETPRSILIGNKEFLIKEILWRKRTLSEKSKKIEEVFKCKINGHTVKLTITDKKEEWSLTFLKDSKDKGK